MVYAACRLAFTDWDQHFRLISVSFLEGEEHSLTWQTSATPLKNLCQSIIDITVGGRQQVTPDFGENDLVAFQHYGVVFAQSMALHQNLNLDACYIRILPGQIAINGEKKVKIYTDPGPRQREVTHASETAHLESNETEGTSIADPEPQIATYRPADHFPESPVISRVKLYADHVALIRNVVTDNHLQILPGPRDIFRALKKLFVTTPCGHSYYGELSVETMTHHGVFEEAIIHQGILISSNRLRWPIPCLGSK